MRLKISKYNLLLKISILLLIVHCSLFIVQAQDGGVKITNKSDKAEIINGKKYYIHTVLKGQTLYSIAKAYSVSVDDIVRDNPEIKSAPINTGQKLKISIKTANVEVKAKSPELIPVKKDSMIMHTVRAKETLYSISKKYNVTEEQIRNANPDQNMNIQTGQIIKVPYVEDAAKEKKKGFIQNIFNKPVKTEAKKDTVIKPVQVKKQDTIKVTESKTEKTSISKADISNEIIKVALLLPLYLNEADEIITEETEDSKAELKPASFYRSFTYLQYYEGVMLALDSLKSMGLKTKTYVYDVYNDSTLTNKALNKAEFANMNLILCPVMKFNYSVLINFAKKHNINIATYSHLKSETVKDFSKLFNLIPSEEEQQIQLGLYLASEFENDKIIIAYQGSNQKEQKNAEAMKQNLIKLYTEKKIKNEIGFVDLSKEGLSAIKEKMSSLSNNVIISLISDEVLISEYIRYLNDIKPLFRITLFGSQSWESLQNVEKDYLENLNMHIYSTNFIDYSRDEVKKFVTKFRKEYKTEPNLYAFLGYDATSYFMHAMMKLGKTFDKDIMNYKLKLLEVSFSFKKTENGGFENGFLNIYRYQDYKLVNARNN